MTKIKKMKKKKTQKKVAVKGIKTPFPIKLVVAEDKPKAKKKNYRHVSISNRLQDKDSELRFRLPRPDELIQMPKKDRALAQEIFDNIANGKTAGYILVGEVKSRDKRGDNLKGATFVQHMSTGVIMRAVSDGLGIPHNPLQGLLGELGNLFNDNGKRE